MKRNDSIALEVQLLAGLGVALLWWVWGFYDQACVVATYSAPTPFCSFVDKHAKGFLPLLAPLVSAPTLLFWWLRRDKHRRADLRHQSTRLLTERFSQAVELLGHSDESVRQGAIYALERLAWDSPEHHWTVMETLAAYVRNHAPIAPTKTALAPTRTALAPMTTDVQAALTALGRRKKEHREAEKVSEGCRINLSRCDLRGADLSRHGDKGMDGHFKCAEFAGSLLNEANMRGIDLAKADLRGARLENATLIGAVMNEANLEEACLDKSNLCGADLDMAKLDSAHLQNAKYNSTTIFPNTWGNNTKTQASAAKSRGMIRLD